jgi:hypothetical protein
LVFACVVGASNPDPQFTNPDPLGASPGGLLISERRFDAQGDHVIIVRDPKAADAVPQPEVRTLVHQRFASLMVDEEPYDPDAMGYLIVMQPGDKASDLAALLHFDPLTNRYSGIRFDQPDFTPSHEILEEHRTCYEIVFVISDDGFGIGVFVPKEEGIDPELLAMCSMHSVNFEEPSEP